MEQRKPLLVAIVGPTAAGKSSLAVALAKRHSGEIVSADSMQVYRGLDIGTAKPSREKMEGIPHHCIGFLEPGESFSVAEYAPLARNAVRDILSRGKLPVLVGGTGLYIRAVVDNIVFDAEAVRDPALRESLRAIAAERGPAAVHAILAGEDPAAAAALHPNDLGRVIRAVEYHRLRGKSIRSQAETSRRTPAPFETVQIGLTFRDRRLLYDRIDRRVDRMMAEGLLAEARSLYGRNGTGFATQAIGYKEFIPYFDGSGTLEESVEALKRSTRRYAKRQLTWFRADGRIRWIRPDELPPGTTPCDAAEEFLNAGSVPPPAPRAESAGLRTERKEREVP